jgi:polyvinyl alcohol dehydrogenase (cytochrome)
MLTRPGRCLNRWRRVSLGTIFALGLVATAVPAGGLSASVRHSGSIGGAGAVPAGDLLTYDYDNSRSGHDPADIAMKGLSASPAWNDNSLDGAVFGEPLVYGSAVYVATENDTLYAIAATTGKVLWKLHVGTAVSLSVVDSAPTLNSGCGDINPLGITGTPVIDPSSDEIFLAEETETAGQSDWEHIRHFLVAISLVTHQELWNRDIDPPHGNSASHYYIPAEQQRPAVTLLGGRLYVPFGGLDGDCGQYHGYLVELPESGKGPLESYQVPTQREGAIWETNGSLVSPQGDLYVATGNGSSNNIAQYDEGNSVIELSPSLARLGSWAPGNWVQLNDEDWDLGSGGPIQVPGTSLLFVAGKPTQTASYGYLMREGHLGGIGKGAFTGEVCSSGGVFGADASDVLGSGNNARVLIYAPCGGATVALQVDASTMSFKRAWSSTGSPNGPPIVAAGLVWALDWDNGELYGMNPGTGDTVVRRATDPLNHFATPGVGDQMVFVPTQGGVESFRISG